MRRNRTFRKFEDWHAHDVEQKLGLCRHDELELLNTWLASTQELPREYAQLLMGLRDRLSRHGREWNEAELQLQFIGPFLYTVGLWGDGFDSYSQRRLAAQLGEVHVEGYIDWMTASGSYEPEKPYFFVHEYKRFKMNEADPLGQLLIAMVAAAALNADGKPIYGCYVVGQFWHFVLLHENCYGVSQGFDALDRGELGRIWHTLRRTRELIVQRVAEEQAG